MENTFLKITAITGFSFGLFAFAKVNPASITGKIIPAYALKDVWIVSTKDTLRALIMQGNFSIVNVKPGTYKVIINAAEPYKDIIKDSIMVTGEQPVDLGEIKLEK